MTASQDVQDPNSQCADDVSQAPPAPAAPMDGSKSGMTLFTPANNAYIDLGASVGSSADEKNPGIRMRADDHVHHTAGSPLTSVMLGGSGGEGDVSVDGLGLYTAGDHHMHVVGGTNQHHEGPVVIKHDATHDHTVTGAVTITHKATHTASVSGDVSITHAANTKEMRGMGGGGGGGGWGAGEEPPAGGGGGNHMGMFGGETTLLHQKIENHINFDDLFAVCLGKESKIIVGLKNEIIIGGENKVLVGPGHELHIMRTKVGATTTWINGEEKKLEGMEHTLKGVEEELKGSTTTTNGVTTKTEGLVSQVKGLRKDTDGLADKTAGLQSATAALARDALGVRMETGDLYVTMKATQIHNP